MALCKKYPLLECDKKMKSQNLRWPVISRLFKIEYSKT